MEHVDDKLRERLQRHDQEHVLAWWNELTSADRRALHNQLHGLDFEHLRQLYERRHDRNVLPPWERVAPVPVVREDDAPPDVVQQGEDSLRRGEVAALVVAGGQGSRLGFDLPKGMFPVGPVSNKSLYQIHAEKILALTRRYGAPIPFLVMTSEATHAPTEAFFQQHQFFGLPPSEVVFFQQGTMPALDLETGRLLMERPGRLFTSPNGHGGTLTALAETGLLDRLRQRGIQHLYYFQVDNPLVKIADPLFLGHHVRTRSEASSKVVPKEHALDKLGNFVQVDGRCTIVEYSDLPDDLARATDASGQLRLSAGSPAIHLFDLSFLARVTQGTTRIPYHVAKKKVPHWHPSGNVVEPERENAVKFEMFIFDALPLAERWLVIETSRREEFAPLKNATGADSPEMVRQAISNLAADWLERAGTAVPRNEQGHSHMPVEISPLVALTPEDLHGHTRLPEAIEQPTYLQPS